MSELECKATTTCEEKSLSAIVASSLASDISEVNSTGCQASEVDLQNGTFVIKVPRANSKLILQNMEEVLNSVKKKHRQKHRRKKEQKKLALLAEEKLRSSEIDNAVSTSASKSAKHKKPLQEQQVLQTQHDSSNDVPKGKYQHSKKRRKSSSSPLSSVLSAEHSAGSILQHLIRTPKKEREEQIQVDTKKETSKPNAFEVMMNARNKTIGSNTPGKEANVSDNSFGVNGEEQSSSINAKRKLLLQSWADRKGGLKRRLEEEMRATYVDEQLENRAKRLKKLLTKGSSPNTNKVTKSRATNSDDKCNEEHKSTTPERSKTSLRQLRKASIGESSHTDRDNSDKLDPETKAFLSRLSSPTKKRDSLLGYFSKVPSPRDAVSKSDKNTSLPETPTIEQNHNRPKTIPQEKNEFETPKRRGRNLKTNHANDVAPKEGDSQIEAPTSMRPKRNCARKSVYEFDDDDSPTKSEKPSKTDVENMDSRRYGQRRSTRKSSVALGGKIVNGEPESVDEIETIALDDSASDVVDTPKKLAPLFLRNMPKPSPDPETLKARQEFLRSGVPEKLRLEQDKQKQFEQNYEETSNVFPRLSHLTQFTSAEVEFFAGRDSSNLSFRYRWTDETFCETYSEGVKRSTRVGGTTRKSKSTKTRDSLLGITNCTPQEYCPEKALKNGFLKTNAELLPTLSNKRLIVKSWKVDFDRFPTYKCYNQLRAKYRFFSALDSTQNTEQVTESFVVTRTTRSATQRSLDNTQDEDMKPPDTAPNGELLFVEKYKPMLFEQVLVNLTPVAQLRDFLASWANGTAGGSLRNSQNFCDDSMDFLNDSNSSQQSVCNSVVLLGPTSSGKTNAVFTLANEMNFNVLEINAGMKRTGKKLIQELQEATQSHQIRNEAHSGTAVKSKAQKHLLKMSLNGLKHKKQSNGRSQENDGANSGANDLQSRKCLILIEDADIVFEQTDAGFTDAIYTLAASSKRPVIVVASNPNCQHLQRLMNQNTIKFSAPNALSISKYLAVLSLLENCPVSLDDLISLFLYNNHDLRKTLHELQFFIQSGGDHDRDLTENADKVQQPNTPEKSAAQAIETTQNGKYFASPNKRRFSEDTQSLLGPEHDEQLKREIVIQQQSQELHDDNNFYTHRSLFKFYTVDQNEKWRVPFPVNFDLFNANLNVIFSVSQKLVPPTGKCSQSTRPMSKNTKRKTRSPKKTWLSAATLHDVQSTDCVNLNSGSPLDALSTFYDNISVATLLVTVDEYAGWSAKLAGQQRDRLTSYLSEFIAHDIVEHAINVNLEAKPCAYNLFDGPKKTSTISDLIGNMMAVHSGRARSVDYEPTLRAICRSENQRASQERRSTRFYHYLRNSYLDNSNFCQRVVNTICSAFQDEDLEQPGQAGEGQTDQNVNSKELRP